MQVLYSDVFWTDPEGNRSAALSRKKGIMEVQKKQQCGSAGEKWTERHIGYEVRTLDNMIGRLVSAYQAKVDEKAGITRMQGWIIGYLYRHSEEDIFQKDVEAEFQIARSTASGILQVMEKKNLITRESIPRDARLKRLVLTEKGMEFQMEIMENFDRVQRTLSKEIPPEKLECFLEVVDMIKTNASNDYIEKWEKAEATDKIHE